MTAGTAQQLTAGLPELGAAHVAKGLAFRDHLLGEVPQECEVGVGDAALVGRQALQHAAHKVRVLPGVQVGAQQRRQDLVLLQPDDVALKQQWSPCCE
jgi:hypothetical protein